MFRFSGDRVVHGVRDVADGHEHRVHVLEEARLLPVQPAHHARKDKDHGRKKRDSSVKELHLM
jgi:hypothetical protein